MKVDNFILYCGKCDFVDVKAKDVKVTKNLKNDTTEYRSKCPKCGKKIFNSRHL